ncbi:hypothetical protein F1737_11225 [Methanoplanus sp. FWC-SCC4]|uniref:Uncharacterized protein n=1 Tax=Methanochimaera problematica TaxID=2609417 RepID=A0AA97FGW5_9EURY|nr:hypothetical protein [Methanoplanus sp. FWC-SCC4]WOF17211.1 hypothetical protein F1737_11225 [Methanoplanus sp. FWC-SCC4]
MDHLKMIDAKKIRAVKSKREMTGEKRKYTEKYSDKKLQIPGVSFNVEDSNGVFSDIEELLIALLKNGEDELLVILSSTDGSKIAMPTTLPKKQRIAMMKVFTDYCREERIQISVE